MKVELNHMKLYNHDICSIQAFIFNLLLPFMLISVLISGTFSAQVVFEPGKTLEKTCAIQLTIEGYIIKVAIMAAESF